MKAHIDVKKTVTYLCFSLFFFAIAVTAGNAGAPQPAHKTDSPAKDGGYIGGSYVFNNVEGDFNDTKVYSSETEVDDIPDLMNGSGFGVFAGGRHGRFAFELGYQRVSHDKNSSLLGPGKAKWHVINTDFKTYFLTSHKFQPFFQIGMAFPWLNIEDSEVYSGGLRKLTVAGGIGLNLGGGLAYYINPKWCVSGTGLYRVSRFARSGGDTIDPKLSSNGFTYSINFAHTFGR
jgi:hypothetical protein